MVAQSKGNCMQFLLTYIDAKGAIVYQCQLECDNMEQAFKIAQRNHRPKSAVRMLVDIAL